MRSEEARTMPKWEYLARNLKKIIGPGMESDFNKLGREGWEFVAVAKDYAVFKRQLAEQAGENRG
jgi:hypothetical protein